MNIFPSHQINLCNEAPPIDVLHLKEVKPLVQIINDEPWFTMTPQHYSNLGQNMQDIKSLANQLKVQRDYYKQCMEKPNESSKTHD